MPLAAFLATDRRRAILNQQAFSEKPSCLLFIDIAGFSALTRQMVAEQQARRGTEALLELLNQLYAELIDGIHAYEGSVIYFAGDALTCSFAAPEAALRAAFHLQALMQDKDVALKLSLSYGQVQRHSFGQQPAFDVPLGEAVEVLNVANEVARANDIIISQTMLPLLSSEFSQQLQLSPVEDAPALARVQLVIPLNLPLPASKVAETSLDNSLLQPYVPAFLQQQSHFITELRPCVTLFCQISYTEQATDVARLLHDFIPAVQACLAQQGGKILEFTTDDKGHVIYAPFGAPVAYKDDSIRACRSALAILNLQKNFPQLNLRLALHQGILRTGFIGSEQRRSYAMTGQATNATAAMMMQADPNSILISDALAQQLPARFRYGQEAQLIHLKEAQQLISYPLQAEQVTAQLRSEVMVGREAELEQLSHYIHAKEKIALQVIAEAGLGKSLLLRQAMHQHRDIPFYIGEAEPQQQQTAYYIWRFILRNFLHITSDDGEAVSQQLHQLLPANLHERLSLLSPVLAIALPEQNFAKNLSPEVRQQATSALIMEILEHVASQHFFVLVLEDCHWLDDLSRQLLELIVARKSQNFALLLLSRQPVLDDEEVEKLELSSLSPSAAQALIQSHLGEQPINQSLVNLILEKAEGNPFYLEELLHYIKAHDKLEHIEELPATLHSLVLSRFDSLPSAQKTLLRVASVVGRYFNSEHLRQYAEELQQVEAWDDKLDELLDKSFLLKEINRQQGIESDYFFKHILNQEIIYTSLSYRFREKLHEAYADFVLENLEHELDILAYHYKNSANKLRAMEFLQEAGEAAVKQFAIQTALHHYKDLLALQLKTQKEPEAIIRSKLELAKCYDRLVEWQVAEDTYQEIFAYIEDAMLTGNTKLYQQALVKEDYAGFIGVVGKSGEAYENFTDSLAFYQQLNKTKDILRLKESLLIQYLTDARLKEAAALATELILDARRYNNRHIELTALDILSNLQVETKPETVTLESLMKVYTLAIELNSVQSLSHVETTIAIFKAKTLSMEAALPHFENAASIAQKLGNMQITAMIFSNIAIAYGRKGLYTQAILHINRALQVIPKENTLAQFRFFSYRAGFAIVAPDSKSFDSSLSKMHILYDALGDYQYKQSFGIYIAWLDVLQNILQGDDAKIPENYRIFSEKVSAESIVLQSKVSEVLTLYISVSAWYLKQSMVIADIQQVRSIQLLGFLQERWARDAEDLDDFDLIVDRKPICQYFYQHNLAILQQHSDSQIFADNIAKGKKLNEAEALAWALNVDSLGI